MVYSNNSEFIESEHLLSPQLKMWVNRQGLWGEGSVAKELAEKFRGGPAFASLTGTEQVEAVVCLCSPRTLGTKTDRCWGSLVCQPAPNGKLHVQYESDSKNWARINKQL